MREALEEAMSYDRLEGVELELSPLGSEVYRLRDHWIDLPRHDGRACLHRRQVDFPQPRTGSRGEQPEVVTYLGKLDRYPLEHAGELNKGTGILCGLDQVLRRDKPDTGDLR